MKQTAIEWLINQVEDNMGDIPPEIKAQAKKMEKGLIEYSKQKGYTLGWLDGLKQGIEEGNNKKEIKR